MDRGNIPGYYRDPETGKYYKIQANHVAPPEAKYSQSSVKRARADQTKRENEARKEKRLRKQTVAPAMVLNHPLLGGSGLLREHGHSAYAHLHAQRDAAFVKGLQHQEPELSPKLRELQPWDSLLTISNSHRLPCLGKSVVAITHGPGSHCLYLMDGSPYKSSTGATDDGTLQRLHAFHDTIQTITHAANMVVACSFSGNNSSDNVFLANLDTDFHAMYNLAIVSGYTEIWDCKLRSGATLNVAFAGSRGVEVHDINDLQRVPVVQLWEPHKGDAYACEWIDNNTLAFGARHPAIGVRDHIKNPRQAGDRTNIFRHSVFFADLRADQGGTVERFQSKDRITGLHLPDDSGNNLLVSTSRHINLFDRRNLRKDQPLLSIDHLSGTTKLHMSTYQGDLLTALDDRNRIQVYSLRSGQNLRTFGVAGKGLLQKPTWQEDERGVPYLESFARSTFHLWN